MIRRLFQFIARQTVGATVAELVAEQEARAARLAHEQAEHARQAAERAGLYQRISGMLPRDDD